MLKTAWNSALGVGPKRIRKPATFSGACCGRTTRYKDCKAPEEEKSYQPPSESVRIERAARPPQPIVQSRHCEAGQPRPKTGFWFTPARTESRQRFEAGQVMPDAGGDYGATICQWDEVQI